MARCRDRLLCLKYRVAHAAVTSGCLACSRTRCCYCSIHHRAVARCRDRLLPFRTACSTLIFYRSVRRTRRLGTRHFFSDMVAEQNVICSLRNNIISHAAVDLNRLPYTFSLCQAAILRKFQMQDCLALFFANTCRKSILVFIRLFRQRIDQFFRHFFSIRIADTPFYRGKWDIYCLISRRQYYRTDIDRFHGIEFTFYANLNTLITNNVSCSRILNLNSDPGLTTLLCINDTVFYLNNIGIIIAELYIVLVFCHFPLVKRSVFVNSTAVYIHLYRHLLTRKEVRTCMCRAVNEPVANCRIFRTDMCNTIDRSKKVSIFISNAEFQFNLSWILSSLHAKAITQCFYMDNIVFCIVAVHKLNFAEPYRIQLPIRTIFTFLIKLQL